MKQPLTMNRIKLTDKQLKFLQQIQMTGFLQLLPEKRLLNVAFQPDEVKCVKFGQYWSSSYIEELLSSVLREKVYSKSSKNILNSIGIIYRTNKASWACKI